jgi:hypothetical protein
MYDTHTAVHLTKIMKRWRQPSAFIFFPCKMHRARLTQFRILGIAGQYGSFVNKKYKCWTFKHPRLSSMTYPEILFGGGGSTNSVEDRENGDLGRLPTIQGFWRQQQFGTRNFISHNKIFLIFHTLKLFRLSFVKTSEFLGGGRLNIPPPPRYANKSLTQVPYHGYP